MSPARLLLPPEDEDHWNVELKRDIASYPSILLHEDVKQEVLISLRPAQSGRSLSEEALEVIQTMLKTITRDINENLD